MNAVPGNTAHENAAPADGSFQLNLRRIYVWELPVRLVHWLLFLSIITLAGTGYYIGNPFASAPLLMATVRAVHLYASIVFTLCVLVRVYWAFAGNRYARWSDLIPASRERLRSLWTSVKFYSFLGREPDEYVGHNGLAGLTYAFIFGVYFVMIATGLALYTVDAPVGSPMRAFAFLIPFFGGLQMAHLIHHIGMWLILVFVVAHLYFVVLSSTVEHVGIFDSILSGFKYMPRRRRRGGP